MDLDITLFIQLGILVVLLISLNGVLFRPFKVMMQSRHRQIYGMKEEVARLDKLSAEHQAEYESRIAAAKSQAQRERELLRQAGRQTEKETLQAARTRVTETLVSARAQLAEVEQASKRDLKQSTDALAHQVVAKLLSNEVAS